jgi:hypothetical protein
MTIESIVNKEQLRLDIIEGITINHWCRHERPIAAELLNDLRQSRHLDKWLFFGDSAIHIIRNYYEYKTGLKWDYTLEDVVINEYGWYNIRLEEVCEEVKFKIGNKCTTAISFDIVANVKRTKFTFGKRYALGLGGGSCGGHIYGNYYSSIHDATIAAIDDCLQTCTKFIQENKNYPSYLQSAIKLKKIVQNYRMSYVFKNRENRSDSSIPLDLFSNNVVQGVLF